MKEERAEYRALLSTLDHVLFLTPSTDTNTTNTNYQEFLQTSRLVPSFYDRRPYFGLISKDSNSLSDSEDVSYQLMARQLFTSRIQEEVARLQVRQREDISLFFLLMFFTCRALTLAGF